MTKKTAPASPQLEDIKFEKDPRACRIVCTLGPASSNSEIIEKLIAAGMNVARLNFSHGTQETHERLIREIRAASEKTGRPIAIMQDLQGHKVRLGRANSATPIILEQGTEIILGPGEKISTERLGMDYVGAERFVEPGHRIFLDDAKIELEVISCLDEELLCKVRRGAPVYSRKGVIFPDSELEFPVLDENDLEDARFGVNMGLDMVAMSFVRSADEITKMRKHLAGWGKKEAFIVAKVEDGTGIHNLEEILKAANAVLIARGDLGVTLPREKVPGIQKSIISQANALGVPSITATQMLESMIDHPQPTRAEVNDVYTAVLDGSHAIMLSAETAMGDYPEESVAEMDRIAREAELELNRRNRGVHTPVTGKEGINDLLAASAVIFAEHMSADCILAFSLEGTTHRALSTASPTVPVYGVLVNHSNLRRLLLHRGLNLTTMPLENKLESLVPRAVKKLRDDGIVGSADKVIIVSRQPEPEADESFLLRLSILS